MVTTPADAISDCVPSYVEIVLWAQIIGGFREGFGQEIIVRIDGGDVQFRSWVRGAGRGFVGAKVERGRFVHACHYRRILVLLEKVMLFCLNLATFQVTYSDSISYVFKF